MFISCICIIILCCGGHCPSSTHTHSHTHAHSEHKIAISFILSHRLSHPRPSPPFKNLQKSMHKPSLNLTWQTKKQSIDQSISQPYFPNKWQRRYASTANREKPSFCRFFEKQPIDCSRKISFVFTCFRVRKKVFMSVQARSTPIQVCNSSLCWLAEYHLLMLRGKCSNSSRLNLRSLFKHSQSQAKYSQ